MNQRSKFIVFFILVSSSFAGIIVENVRFFQRKGTNLVDIYYDLSDTEGGDKFIVSLSLSTDGGRGFSIIPTTLSGDYGSNINSGKNKQILWDAGADFDNMVGDNFVFKVMAKRTGAYVPPAKTRFTYLVKNTQGYDEYRHEKTGMVLIKIPAGEFWMGSAASEGADDEHPQHKVYLNEYYIGKYEITNELFERFVKETGYKTDAEKEGTGYTYEGGKWEERAGRNWRYYYSAGREEHPVVLVSWNDTKAFCDWAGLRLPTEAEWEKAARGTDGRQYPWGNAWDGNKCASGSMDISLMKSKTGYVDMGGGRSTVLVGSFASGLSPYGCYDMAGNVWEWCADWFDENYYGRSANNNPPGPSSGANRVLRGGCWIDVSNYCRSAYRWSGPASRHTCRGFRVASSP